jgi:DNA-binding protein WhiA
MFKKNTTPFKLSTESSSFARRLVTIFKKLGYKDVKVEIKKNHVNRKNFFYILKCESFSMNSFIHLNKEDGSFYHWDEKLNPCCKRSIARGCFIAGGWLTNPQKSYSLQFTFSSLENMDFYLKVMSDLGFSVKNPNKNQDFILYLKDAEAIADFLSTIGATNSLMKFENIRILKEVKNNVNRAVNCETANLEKIVVSSLRQIENIVLIEKTIGLFHLPKKLREMAEVRLNNREASLQDLGELILPPIGKSGVNHRLKKLEKIAQEIREGKGEKYGRTND